MALMAGKKDKDTENAFQQVLKIVEDTDSVEQEFKRLEVNIMNSMCCACGTLRLVCEKLARHDSRIRG